MGEIIAAAQLRLSFVRAASSISLSDRHTVGTDATGPNSPPWSRSTAVALRATGDRHRHIPQRTPIVKDIGELQNVADRVAG